MNQFASGYGLHPILEHDTAARSLGVEIERADYGNSRVHLVITGEMLNGHGMCHGGIIFTLADTCFALSCNDKDGDGSTITVAQNCDIDFLRPAMQGDRLTATSVLRQGARRSSIHDITVVNQDGKTVAEFRGRARTVPTQRDAAPSQEK